MMSSDFAPRQVSPQDQYMARHHSHGQYQNVGSNEKWLSMLAGGGLMFYGVNQRSRWGLVNLLIGASLIYRGWTGHCTMYEQLGIDTSDEGDRHHGVRAQHGRKVKWTIHVNRDKQELYDHWRKLENLPKIMRHLEAVTPIDEQRSRWAARGPMGKTLTWEAEIITDRPGETIAWQSLPGSQVDTAGSVHFTTPTFGEGTEIVVTLKYDPPGGAAAAAVAYFFGEGLEQEIQEDLRAFKQLFEAGEVATAAQHPK